jgi:deoxycytidylate deaminase
MKRDRKFIEQCFVLAQSVERFPNAKLASMIVLGNRIISYGWNQSKTHTFVRKYSRFGEDHCYLHAEVHAIKNALRIIDPEDLEKATLYVARAKRPDNKSKRWIYGLAKPCEGCQKAIDDFSIRRVVYTLDGKGFSYL